MKDLAGADGETASCIAARANLRSRRSPEGEKVVEFRRDIIELSSKVHANSLI